MHTSTLHRAAAARLALRRHRPLLPAATTPVPQLLRRLPRRATRCAAVSARGFASSAANGFECRHCGQSFAKWQGQCSSCSQWGSVVSAAADQPFYRQSHAPSTTFARALPSKRPVALGTLELSALVQDAPRARRMNEVEVHTSVERLELPDRELNWVLGGGIVAGSMTLLAGNPGVGKSTLALQMANMLANKSSMQAPGVLYVSGEETARQVRMRAERLGPVSNSLFVASETNLDAVFQLLDTGCGPNVDRDTYRGFGAVVVDSIQTVYAADVPSPAGTVTQVKECTLRLLRLAKSRNVPVVLIGHVTKSGDIAGPKVLEHIVDTVVHLEGDPQSPRRFLRCQKNRFGSTDEVGVFNMTDEGLQQLPNPLMAFVSARSEDRPDDSRDSSSADVEAELDGCALTIAIEGKRPFPLEIQALANRAYNVDAGRNGSHSFSRVRGVGVAYDKLLLLFAVLEKRAKVSCRNQSVFVNIAEGYTIQEPAADLALAVALASAVLGRPVVERTAFLGEMSLSGHLRPVKLLESRLTAAHKIGLEVCVIPRVPDEATRRALHRKYADTLAVVEVSTLLQALKIAFRTPPTASSVKANGSA